MARFLVPQRSLVIRRQSTLEATLPEGHLARFVWVTLCCMSFTELEAGYASIQGGPGRSPYHPRLLAALWIYGMTQGLGTAVGIAMACENRDDFRWLAGGLCPSDQTLLNLLELGPDGLSPIWVQMLHAMQAAGHIDLSVLAEDGSKMRANVSPRSFHTAEEIVAVTVDLKQRVAEKLRLITEASEPTVQKKLAAEAQRVKRQLRHAQEASAELDERRRRRLAHGNRAQPPLGALSEAVQSEGSVPTARPAAIVKVVKFGREDFRHDAQRDVLVCPAGDDLRFVGQYVEGPGRTAYRLFCKSDCSACPLKAQCTEARGRRIKVPLAPEACPMPTTIPASTEVDSAAASPQCGQPNTAPATAQTPSAAPATDVPARGPPVASLTEPEALMMLATSQKRFEPSYNADITVTRHGVIVSHFLTKQPTDFPNFRRALPAVVSTLGQPDSWVGDGHYGTKENVVLADEEGVVLYAPSARKAAASVALQKTPGAIGPTAQLAVVATDPEPAPARFGRSQFQHHDDRDTMICPASQELPLIGTYLTDSGLGTYRLYGRSDCSGCNLKLSCTEAKGRRLKVYGTPRSPACAEPGVLATVLDLAAAAAVQVETLVNALEARMAALGARVMKFRGATVEPVHAQLKQHGLRRFHVHGLARCGAVLTLACVGHNIMKWKAREVATAMRSAA